MTSNREKTMDEELDGLALLCKSLFIQYEKLVSEMEVLRSELARSGSEREKAKMVEIEALKNQKKIMESELNKVKEEKIELEDRFRDQELKLVELELAIDVTVVRKICDDTTAAHKSVSVSSGSLKNLSAPRTMTSNRECTMEEEEELKGLLFLSKYLSVAREKLVSEMEVLRSELARSWSEREKAMMVEIDALKNQKKIMESELNKVKEEKIELEERFRDGELKLVELVGKANEPTNDVTVLLKICDDTTDKFVSQKSKQELKKVEFLSQMSKLKKVNFYSRMGKQELKKVEFLSQMSKQELRKVNFYSQKSKRELKKVKTE